MEFSMVRQITEIYFGGVQEDSAALDGEVIEIDDSNRAVNSSSELVAAFKRFVGLNKGSFSVLLKKWVRSRRKSPQSENFTPQSKRLSQSLKIALQDGFNQVREKKA